ncbi:Gfo/Idh/MocA family protein [Alkalicoccus chagannorensis]|uniref:Gfo/Idh/MocA family protein n=1 Tax=Alkalicoccus chagannorensis TaxID=427072 RepID=UPI00047D80F8|nr:Gfo/Idh/MocA family oxidoreductase [Alkalicoccus chagannorensis]
MTYRVGIIGPGMIARGAHMRALAADPRAEIIAVCSRTEATAVEAAQAFHVPNVYTSEQEMLDAHDFDLVIVATPNKYHERAVHAALQAGAHVLCEKPPGVNAMEALRMEEAARQQNRHLMYGFHHRFHKETEVLKRAVDDGELGSIYHLKVEAMRRRGIPGWGAFTDKELQGGGPLIDIGVHMLDLAMYIGGFLRPVEVSAVTHQRLGRKPGVGLLGDWDPASFSVEDMAAGMIRFEHGVSLSLEASYAANIEEEETLNVTFLGDRGGASTSPFRMYGEKYGSLLDIHPVHLDKVEPRDGYERQIAHVLDVVEGKAKPISEAWQGTYIQQLIDAMYTSASEGRSIAFTGE